MTQLIAAVVGQLARELVLTADRMPEAGADADAIDRREQLGGKGAHQAVALARRGVRPRLIAVAGDDVIGDVLLDQARRDGVDTGSVVRRRDTLTGLIVELRDAGARPRHLRHLPPPVLLTAADIAAARDVIASADAVLVEPVEAALAAARIGHEAGRLVVLDGEVTDRRLLAVADVVRADESPATHGDGPALLALTEPDGYLFVWQDGRLRIPRTGGGDSFTAALTAALLQKMSYQEAAQLAAAAH